MKKETIIYCILSVVIVVLVFSDTSFLNHYKTQTKTIDLSNIHCLKIDFPCQVYITYGTNDKLMIETQSKYMPSVCPILQGSSLQVVKNNQETIFGNVAFNEDLLLDKIKIYINYHDLSHIAVSERAEIISRDFKPCTYKYSSIGSPIKDLPLCYN